MTRAAVYAETRAYLRRLRALSKPFTEGERGDDAGGGPGGGSGGGSGGGGGGGPGQHSGYGTMGGGGEIMNGIAEVKDGGYHQLIRLRGAFWDYSRDAPGMSLANWTVYAGTATDAAGSIQFTAPGAGTPVARAMHNAGGVQPAYRDLEITGNITLSVGGEGSILARWDDAANNGYELKARNNLIAPDRIELNRIDGGVRSALGLYLPTAIAPGDDLTLRIVGDQLTVSYNGTVRIGPITDATYTEGEVGTGAGGTMPNDFTSWHILDRPT